MKGRPLVGIRVLERGAYVSAPYAGSLLCALGADSAEIALEAVTPEEPDRLKASGAVICAADDQGRGVTWDR